ncbi:MAG: SMC family ATPase [Actinobacteria bacterium]|nr:SMC family ATPase [Actinomycetota bacterium]
MRITRLLLRNFRVFADELELEVPPGLVGIYGANGSGKTTLVSAIPWALFGHSRTSNDEVRTAGVDAESITEVEFEHEAHLYAVRRTISGVNSTVRARAWADGLLVADGARDTARYVRSLLGIDDASFRASVFAEQNQLAAFSTIAPAKRRDLVLKLLGITPLDAARDRARRDARAAADDHARLRALLPDLDALGAAATDARSVAREAEHGAEAARAELGERRRQLGLARREHDQMAVHAGEHEALVTEGRMVRSHHDAAARRVADLERELAQLSEAGARLARLEGEAEGLAAAEARLAAVQRVREAEAALAATPASTEPPVPDEDRCAAARRAAEDARGALATHDALVAEARRQRASASAALHDSVDLSGEEECPLCGQTLDEAFEQVQAHRRGELARVEAHLSELDGRRPALVAAADDAADRTQHESRALEQARQARAAWERHRAARDAAEEALRQARARLDPPLRPEDEAELPAEVERRRQAAKECQLLRGRLDRQARAERELEAARDERDSGAGRLDALREKVRALSFDHHALASARQALDLAEQAVDVADVRTRRSEVDSARAEAAADAAERTLAAGAQQHAKLGELAEHARHLGRLAELLHQFRNQLVGSVGPRLSRQAASLFAELTDAEYDELQIDPETYAIRILDQGVAYDMDRFSGSETDLANLALRVAISEHLGFQSGGQVGLLVLDEVFGFLDADRKDRMLRALERLRGRFRQVLVVTHDAEVKDRLPNAIEVVKLPGRRATAQVVAGP